MSASSQRAKAQLLDMRPDPEEQRYVIAASGNEGVEGFPDPGMIWDNRSGAWVKGDPILAMPHSLTFAGRAKLVRRNRADRTTEWRYQAHNSADKASMIAMSNPSGVWVSIITIKAWRERELERAVDASAKALGFA